MTASSRWWERARVFFLFSLLLVVMELTHGVYRLFAFEEQRTQLRVLNDMVGDAGVEVIRTQLRADSVRTQLETMDAELEDARELFTALDARATRGRLTAAHAAEYRARVMQYNRRVAVHSFWMGEWERVLADNRQAVRRYNDLADEIRTIAATMGEQHYNIPSPVEAAVKSGLRPE